MSQVSLTVEDVKVATKPGAGKRLLLTLSSTTEDLEAIAAQITTSEELDIELPTHSPNG